MLHELATERLILRRWKKEDTEPYFDICKDPEVMRRIGNGRTRNLAECEDAIKHFEQCWNDHGYGLFAAELKETGNLIGFVGLSIPDFLPEILPSVEIGWRLARNYWGKGLATEGARAALNFGLNDLKLKKIVSVFQIGNDASQRIMEKLGMCFQRKTIDPTCDRPVLVYEIDSPYSPNPTS
ncbi:MAG: GNAT family N-acetyltransferase [bacterium]|nr:GNAT family N-acetyltransferase [bacterium]